MAYTYNPINNELLEMIDLYDDPIIETKRPPEKKKGLNPKEYKQMMNYLTRPKKKPIKREETYPERIARLQYTYDNAGTKPKHMDNPNIYTHEQKPFKKKIKKLSL